MWYITHKWLMTVVTIPTARNRIWGGGLKKLKKNPSE